MIIDDDNCQTQGTLVSDKNVVKLRMNTECNL